MITLSDFTLLKKTMALTFSESDGEALNALRAANAILKKHKLTWREVLERTVTVDVEEGPGMPAHDMNFTGRLSPAAAHGGLLG